MENNEWTDVSFIKDKLAIIDRILETAIRDNAMPKISGPLTRGKLRWRGLRMIQRKSIATGFTENWVEQRGKIISPIVTI